MKIAVRITLDPERHRDVLDTIMAVPKPMRGEYIVEAIRQLKRSYAPQQAEQDNNIKKDNVFDFSKAF